jgi:hypothetical protein
MTTAVHQLRKDVRRHARWLAVWAALCILPLGAFALPANATMAHAALAGIAPALRFVVFVVLTVLVVHEDPLVDSTAFWLTRPIGAGPLLASKLLFVGVLLLLPVVAVDVVYVTCAGVGTPYVLLAIPEIALDWTVWGTGVFALATLTTTLPGFLGAGFKVALLAVAAHWVVRMALHIAHAHSLGEALTLELFGLAGPMLGVLDPWREVPSLLASRTLATLALLTMVGLAVATLQYRSRRTRLTWGALTLGVLVVIGLRAVWAWDFVELPRPEPVVDAKAAEMLRVSLDPTGRLESMSLGGGRGQATDKKTIYARARVEGTTPPVVPEIDRLDGWLTFDDGSRVPLAGRSAAYSVESTWNAIEVEKLLAVRFVNIEQEGATDVPVVSLASAEYARRAGTSGRLAGTALLVLRTYHVAAELPARPDAAYDHGTEHAVVTGVYNESGDCTVNVRETQVSLLLAPNPHAYRRMYMFRFNPDVLYVLRNRARGEAFWPRFGASVGFGWPSRTRIEEIMAPSVYRSNIASNPPLPRIDDAWMADAEVVRIEADSVGMVTRPIEPSTFTIPGDAGARAGVDARQP